jgi:predicted metalloendopeptidase
MDEEMINDVREDLKDKMKKIEWMDNENRDEEESKDDEIKEMIGFKK